MAESGDSDLEIAKKILEDDDPNPPSSEVLGYADTPAKCDTFEILRCLHDASRSRWENRREHEWKLNYAFWAAPAGVIASILFSKEVHFTPPTDPILIGVVAAVVLIHALYLWPVTGRSIKEIEMQLDVECALQSLLKSEIREMVKVEHLAAGMNGRNNFDKRYGAMAPLFVTLVLLITAAWLVSHQAEKGVNPKAADISTTKTGAH